VWDANLTLRVGVDSPSSPSSPWGRVGTAGRRVKGLWDLVVAVLPHGPLVKMARPWLYRPTGGQEGPTRARDRPNKGPAGTGGGDQLVETGGPRPGLGPFYSLIGPPSINLVCYYS